MEKVLIIHPKDNVAVALKNLSAGEVVTAPGIEPFAALEEIPVGHKIALRDLAQGEEIIKYGETVALSKQGIRKGEWVHTHNLESQRWKR